MELLSKRGERVTYQHEARAQKSKVTFHCGVGGHKDRITITNSSNGGIPSVSTSRTKARHGYMLFRSLNVYQRSHAYATHEHNDFVKLNDRLYLVRLPVVRLNIWTPTKEQADIILIATGMYSPPDYQVEKF